MFCQGQRLDYKEILHIGKKEFKKTRTFIIMGLHDYLLQNVIGDKTFKKTWDCFLKMYETKV
jgi:hypothetical protein